MKSCIARCLLPGLGLLLVLPGVAYAESEIAAIGVSQPLILMLVLAALAMAPFVVMMATSFAKLSVVFALVRNGIGTQQIPPNTVITGLALILTIYVMVPVGYGVYREAGEVLQQRTNQPLFSQASVQLLAEAFGKGKEPVREFLLSHTHGENRRLFFDMARELQKDETVRAGLSDKDFLSLVPAFAVSELTEAFQIGFVIFLPFLVIDLVVANLLLSLGMFQISPITIALPFKLLLFVMVDGWKLITQGLVRGYV